MATKSSLHYHQYVLVCVKLYLAELKKVNMDEAQIRALIESVLSNQLESAIGGVIDTLSSHFDTRLDAVKQELGSSKTEPEKAKGGKNETLDRIAQLEKIVEAERKARVEAETRQANLEKERKFDQSFETAIKDYNIQPELRQFLVDTLKTNLKDSELVGDTFVKSGKSLQEHISEFMVSPVGKHFQPYSGQVNGADSQTTSDKPGSADGADDGLAAFLAL